MPVDCNEKAKSGQLSTPI